MFLPCFALICMQSWRNLVHLDTGLEYLFGILLNWRDIAVFLTVFISSLAKRLLKQTFVFFSGRYLANNLKKAKALKEKSSAELQEIIMHQPCKLTFSISLPWCSSRLYYYTRTCYHFSRCSHTSHKNLFIGLWLLKKLIQALCFFVSNCDHQSFYRIFSFRRILMIYETVFILLTANRSITPSLVSKWKLEEIRLVSSKRGI